MPATDTANSPNTAPAALLPYAVVRAFKPKEVFGEPKRALKKMPTNDEGDTIDGNYVRLGIVFGKTTAVMVSQRPDRDGEMTRSYGLEGLFEAIPEDRARNPVRTSKAWLPTHIHDDIAARLRDNDPVDGEVNEDGVDSLEFVFEVGIKSNSKSSTGFTWEYRPLTEMKTVSDPLSHLRGALPKGYVPLALPGVGAVEETDTRDDDRGDEANAVEAHEDKAVAALHANAAAADAKPAKGKVHK